MKQRVIVDTGPLVALLNKRDRAHAWVVQQLRDIAPPMITCEAVLAEARQQLLVVLSLSLQAETVVDQFEYLLGSLAS